VVVSRRRGLSVVVSRRRGLSMVVSRRRSFSHIPSSSLPALLHVEKVAESTLHAEAIIVLTTLRASEIGNWGQLRVYGKAIEPKITTITP